MTQPETVPRLAREDLVGAGDWAIRAHLLFYCVNIVDRFARVACAVTNGRTESRWLVIQRLSDSTQSLFDLERHIGRGRLRGEYNQQSVARALATKTPYLGTFDGFCDWFVPLLSDDKADSVLVAGPFVREQVSARGILDRWQAVSGEPPIPHDPRLLAYARATLDVQVFNDAELAASEELFSIFARALVDEPLPSDLSRLNQLRETVFGRSFASRVWRGGMLIDPLANYFWPGGGELTDLELDELGIERWPNTAVAIAPALAGRHDGTSIAALVEVRDFQRRSAEIGASFAGTLPAALEDYGTYLLFHAAERRSAAAQRLLARERAEEVARVLRREFGFDVAAGIGETVRHPRELPNSARSARLALQLAIQRGDALVQVDAKSPVRAGKLDQTPAFHLAQMTELLASGLIAELASHQAAYVRAVSTSSDGRVGPMRTHFESALDALLLTPWSRGDLDQRTSQELWQRLRTSLEEAASAPALVRAFQDALHVVVRILERPAETRGELKIVTAARYIEEHCHKRLTLEGVARRAGLSKSYFCRCFRRTCQSGFADFLRRARVERSKRLLRDSSLSIHRVARESGFVSVSHFNRAFKRIASVTPTSFREGMQKGPHTRATRAAKK